MNTLRNQQGTRVLLFLSGILISLVTILTSNILITSHTEGYFLDYFLYTLISSIIISFPLLVAPLPRSIELSFTTDKYYRSAFILSLVGIIFIMIELFVIQGINIFASAVDAKSQWRTNKADGQSGSIFSLVGSILFTLSYSLVPILISPGSKALSLKRVLLSICLIVALSLILAGRFHIMNFMYLLVGAIVFYKKRLRFRYFVYFFILFIAMVYFFNYTTATRAEFSQFSIESYVDSAVRRHHGTIVGDHAVTLTSMLQVYLMHGHWVSQSLFDPATNTFGTSWYSGLAPIIGKLVSIDADWTYAGFWVPMHARLLHDIGVANALLAECALSIAILGLFFVIRGTKGSPISYNILVIHFYLYIITFHWLSISSTGAFFYSLGLWSIVLFVCEVRFRSRPERFGFLWQKQGTG